MHSSRRRKKRRRPFYKKDEFKRTLFNASRALIAVLVLLLFLTPFTYALSHGFDNYLLFYLNLACIIIAILIIAVANIFN